MGCFPRLRSVCFSVLSTILLSLTLWTIDLFTLPSITSIPDSQSASTIENTTVAKIRQRGKLRVGVPGDAEPFGYRDLYGRLVGFDIDLAGEFARVWLEDEEALELVEISDRDQISHLLSGKIDLFISAMPRRREQDAFVDFSQSYFMNGQGLLIQDNSAVDEIIDLDGKVIAAIEGSRWAHNIQPWADRHGVRFRLATYVEYPQALAALQAGQVDALTGDSNTLIQFAQEFPGLEILGDRLTQEPYTIVMPQGDSLLRHLVNFTLQDLKIDGTYDRLYRRWFPTDEPYAIEISPGRWPYTFQNIPNQPIIHYQSTAKKILQRKKLIVGIHNAIYPFSFVNGSGQRVGFEIGLAQELARRWLGDKNAVEFVPDQPERHIAQLAEGKIDVILSALEQRRNWASQIDFSQAYLDLPLVSHSLHMGLPHNDSTLRELANVTLQEMKKDGTYEQLYRQWFGSDVPSYELEIIVGDANYLLLPYDAQEKSLRFTAATESTINRIRKRRNQLLVGIQNNAAPFSFLDDNGSPAGFDLDLLQTMTQKWGVDIQFVPVTMTERIPKLLTGEIDLLAGAMPHRREEEVIIDFSQTYFTNGKSLLARRNSGIQGIQDLDGQVVAAIQGSNAAELFQAYAHATNVTVTVRSFPSSKLALEALHSGQVTALTADYTELTQWVRDDFKLIVLDSFFVNESYAFGLPPNDTYFQNLVRFSLEQLVKEGTYDQLYYKWFGTEATPFSVEVLSGRWPYTFGQSPIPLDQPVHSRADTLLSSGKLVAGVFYDFEPFGHIVSTTYQPIGFEIDLMREFAKRWLGDAHAVELVPVQSAERVQKLVDGEVDIVAATLSPRWEQNIEIDFSQTYFEDKLGLLVHTDSDIQHWRDLQGKRVGLIEEWLTEDELIPFSIGLSNPLTTTMYTDSSDALSALNIGQIEAIIAIQTFLTQIAQDHPHLTVTTEYFGSKPYQLGLPKYDHRFRNLVNFTLQEIKLDGTYDRLHQRWFGKTSPYPIEIWSGHSTLELDMIPMVHVPAGEFTRGNKAGTPDERIEQTIDLDGFYIDQYEVTNRQYQKCVLAGHCTLPRLPASTNFAKYYAESTLGNYPVTWVRWEDAKAYCTFLGKRLPTEAEWEKAARGPQNYLYPWGDTPPTIQTNFNLVSGDVAAVGTYPIDVSAYGVYDMAGNVREWVADWYQWDYYPVAPSQNPRGPEIGITKVVRGGGWDDVVSHVRSTRRKNAAPDSYDANLGFRCASSTFSPRR